MELDDLKKSWNALDEHLKNKEFIEEQEIAQLLGRARNKMITDYELEICELFFR